MFEKWVAELGEHKPDNLDEKQNNSGENGRGEYEKKSDFVNFCNQRDLESVLSGKYVFGESWERAAENMFGRYDEYISNDNIEKAIAEGYLDNERKITELGKKYIYWQLTKDREREKPLFEESEENEQENNIYKQIAENYPADVGKITGIYSTESIYEEETPFGEVNMDNKSLFRLALKNRWIKLTMQRKYYLTNEGIEALLKIKRKYDEIQEKKKDLDECFTQSNFEEIVEPVLNAEQEKEVAKLRRKLINIIKSKIRRNWNNLHVVIDPITEFEVYEYCRIIIGKKKSDSTGKNDKVVVLWSGAGKTDDLIQMIENATIQDLNLIR